MAKTFLYATDNATTFLIIPARDDDPEGQEVAEQAISALSGVKLGGRTEIPHSLIVSLSLTMLSKAKADDVLIRRLLEKFKDRGAKIELKNDPHDDGSVQKKILVNDRPAFFLNLTREQVLDFEENGLEDRLMEDIFKRLETVLRRTALRSEIMIVEANDEGGNNDDAGASVAEAAAPAEGRGGGRD